MYVDHSIHVNDLNIHMLAIVYMYVGHIVLAVIYNDPRSGKVVLSGLAQASLVL